MIIPSRRPAVAIATGFVRQVGKDTICSIFRQLDPRFKRYSFADALRRELAPFLAECYGIDVWSMTSEQKEFVRPYLITHGMARRATDPDYWVKRTMDEISRDVAADPETRPFIVDARFENECLITRNRLGAKLVHVTRDGAPPPTDEEMKHYPALVRLADLHFHWGGNTDAEQLARVQNLLDWVNGDGGIDCSVSTAMMESTR